MKTDANYGAASELVSSDLKEIGSSLRKLANHAVKLGGLGFGTSFLKWVACFAAIYLLVLDRTNWKTNMLASLLVPYIYFSLPTWLFGRLSGEIGKWIAFVAVVLRLFFPKHFPGFCSFLRRCICSVLSAGFLPTHVAFIMDGNRRYAKKQALLEGDGHSVGFSALMNMLKYCYELNVKYVTVYAFSIENFKRRPEEVQSTMQLIQEKIESLLEKESIVNRYGVRVHFIGNLKLLSKPVRLAAERAMNATAHNTRAVLVICIAYTSTDEITHSVEESCKEKWDEFRYGLHGVGGDEIERNKPLIGMEDIEKNMYMAVAPHPDIIIRSSGETRLSNFLLWQSASSLLYSPRALWPEIGFWHLVRAILDFQRNLPCLEKKIHMEEVLGNVTAARQIFENWMKWMPHHQGWLSYIKFNYGIMKSKQKITDGAELGDYRLRKRKEYEDLL